MQFVQIPNDLSQNLHILDYLVYANIRKRINRERSCFISLSTISKECQSSIPTIVKSIDRLIENYYFEKSIKGRTTFYQFPFLTKFEVVPFEFLEDNNIFSLEKAVLIAILKYIFRESQDHGYILYSYKQLSELIPCSASTICRVFKSLVDKNYVNITHTELRSPINGELVNRKNLDLAKLHLNVKFDIKEEDNKRRRFKELFEEMLKLDCVY